jgi:hypothetical protein
MLCPFSRYRTMRLVRMDTKERAGKDLNFTPHSLKSSPDGRSFKPGRAEAATAQD